MFNRRTERHAAIGWAVALAATLATAAFGQSAREGWAPAAVRLAAVADRQRVVELVRLCRMRDGAWLQRADAELANAVAETAPGSADALRAGLEAGVGASWAAMVTATDLARTEHRNHGQRACDAARASSALRVLDALIGR